MKWSLLQLNYKNLMVWYMLVLNILSLVIVDANVNNKLLNENVSSMKEAAYIKEGPTVYDPQIPPTLPVSVDSLSHHVATCHANGNMLFKEQFQVWGTFSTSAFFSCLIRISILNKSPVILLSLIGIGIDLKTYFHVCEYYVFIPHMQCGYLVLHLQTMITGYYWSQ